MFWEAMMISLLVAFLANPTSPCDVALAPVSQVNNQIVMLAELVLTYHGAYLHGIRTTPFEVRPVSDISRNSVLLDAGRAGPGTTTGS